MRELTISYVLFTACMSYCICDCFKEAVSRVDKALFDQPNKSMEEPSDHVSYCMHVWNLKTVCAGCVLEEKGIMGGPGCCLI